MIVELFEQGDDLGGFLVHFLEGFFGHGRHIALARQRMLRIQDGAER